MSRSRFSSRRCTLRWINEAPRQMRPGEKTPEAGPQLTLAERDRRYAGLRALMEKQGFDAVVVGSFQGRERLESYLIDDFLDSVVVLPLKSDPVLLAFGGSRISRIFESQRRGHDVWVPDVRMSAGGAKRSEERRVGKECRSRWSPY